MPKTPVTLRAVELPRQGATPAGIEDLHHAPFMHTAWTGSRAADRVVDHIVRRSTAQAGDRGTQVLPLLVSEMLFTEGAVVAPVYVGAAGAHQVGHVSFRVSDDQVRKTVAGDVAEGTHISAKLFSGASIEPPQHFNGSSDVLEGRLGRLWEKCR